MQDELRQARGRVKWTPPDQFHITLKFLGDTPVESVPAIAAVLEELVAKWHPFEVEMEGAGAFPKPARPQTIWAGVKKGGEETARLAAEIDRLVHSFGFPKELRPFRAHLTLGRVKGPDNLSALAEAVRRLQSASVGAFEADRIHFFRSDLKPEVPEYTVLATVRFEG